jgi:ABC-type transport system substrate-binding protein
VVGYGQGEVAYGPISPAVRGYWPGVEKIGYAYNPDKAKALFKEAGYTPVSDKVTLGVIKGAPASACPFKD